MELAGLLEDGREYQVIDGSCMIDRLTGVNGVFVGRYMGEVSKDKGNKRYVFSSERGEKFVLLEVSGAAEVNSDSVCLGSDGVYIEAIHLSTRASLLSKIAEAAA